MTIRGGERGQLLPFMAMVLTLVLFAALALVRVSARATHVARAEAAAEAAALAAAEGGGEPAARQWVTLNHGRLVSYVSDGASVTVVAEVDGARGEARAAPAPAAQDDLDAGLRAALVRAGQLMGGPVPLTSVTGDGLAVDVSVAALAELVPLADQAGLCRPDIDGHATRFDVCYPPQLGTNDSTPQPPETTSGEVSPPGQQPESQPTGE
jgi:hypothetical protein